MTTPGEREPESNSIEVIFHDSYIFIIEASPPDAVS